MESYGLVALTQASGSWSGQVGKWQVAWAGGHVSGTWPAVPAGGHARPWRVDGSGHEHGRLGQVVSGDSVGWVFGPLCLNTKSVVCHVPPPPPAPPPLPAATEAPPARHLRGALWQQQRRPQAARTWRGGHHRRRRDRGGCLAAGRSAVDGGAAWCALPCLRHRLDRFRPDEAAKARVGLSTEASCCPTTHCLLPAPPRTACSLPHHALLAPCAVLACSSHAARSLPAA